MTLEQWGVDTVRGKILSDIINTIVLLNMRKTLDESGLSVSEVTGKAQSLMCFLYKHGEKKHQIKKSKRTTNSSLVKKLIIGTFAKMLNGHALSHHHTPP